MSNKQIVQNWRNQEGAKKGHSIYWAGKTVYSYGDHFPMAYITDCTVDGKTVILKNAFTYSVTTAKHMGYVGYTTYHDQVVEIPTDLLKEIIFCLDNEKDMTDIKEQIKAYIFIQIGKNELKMQRARIRKAYYAEQIIDLTQQVTVLNNLNTL